MNSCEHILRCEASRYIYPWCSAARVKTALFNYYKDALDSLANLTDVGVQGCQPRHIQILRIDRGGMVDDIIMRGS